jgi:hypothetical protein
MRRTKRECGQIGWWNSVNIVQRALSATLPKNRPYRMIFENRAHEKTLEAGFAFVKTGF